MAERLGREDARADSRDSLGTSGGHHAPKLPEHYPCRKAKSGTKRQHAASSWRAKRRFGVGLPAPANGASLRFGLKAATGEGHMAASARTPMHLWIVGGMATVWKARSEEHTS